jgi:hypothetical protein
MSAKQTATASVNGSRGPAQVGSEVPSPYDQILPSKEIWVATYGNDDNPGTLFSPKQTISAAIDIATPGTAIMVKAGKYTDYLLFDNTSGINTKPVWLRSADGYGAAELIPMFPGNEVVRINGSKYVIVEGFKISGPVKVWEGVAPPGSAPGVYGPPAIGVVVQNNIIISSKTSGVIDVRHSDGVYILGNDITAGGRDAITVNDCAGCVVNGNAINTQ